LKKIITKIPNYSITKHNHGFNTLHPGCVNLLHEYLKIQTNTKISYCSIINANEKKGKNRKEKERNPKSILEPHHPHT